MASIERSDDDEVVKKEKLALNDVFNDTSVSQSETRSRLNDIIGDIEIMLDSLPDEE